MRYRFIIPKSVQKRVDRLPDDLVNRILFRLAELEVNPRPADVKKLRGRDGWRIRVGDYCVIFQVHDQELQVLVITVGHRREVYRLGPGQQSGELPSSMAGNSRTVGA